MSHPSQCQPHISLLYPFIIIILKLLSPYYLYTYTYTSIRIPSVCVYILAAPSGTAL